MSDGTAQDLLFLLERLAFVRDEFLSVARRKGLTCREAFEPFVGGDTRGVDLWIEVDLTSDHTRVYYLEFWLTGDEWTASSYVEDLGFVDRKLSFRNDGVPRRTFSDAATDAVSQLEEMLRRE